MVRIISKRFRVRRHNQYMTVAARAQAERNRVGHLSQPVAMRRQSLGRANMFLSCGAGGRGQHRAGFGPCGRCGTGCTGKYPSRSNRCGTNRPAQAGLNRWRRAGSICQQRPGLPEPSTAAPLPRCNPRSGLRTGTSGSGGPWHRPRRAVSGSTHLSCAGSAVRGRTVPALFTARLDAVRCAVRSVASIIAVLVCRTCAASSVMIVANTPIRLHHVRRLQSALGGP